MKYILNVIMFSVFLLSSCAKETDLPFEDIDDSYFTGKFGRFGGILNNGVPATFPYHLIETVAITPKYHFVLRMNLSDNVSLQNNDHHVDVTIFEPKTNEVYIASDVNDNTSANIDYRIATTMRNGESYETFYGPDPARVPILLKIVNMEPGNVLELEIQGWLYNHDNPQDSTDVIAKIKTRPLPKR